MFTNVNPDGIGVSRDDGNAVLTLSNGETITLIGQFEHISSFIEEFEFADGTVWSEQDLRLRMFDELKATGMVTGTRLVDTHHHTLGDGSYTITEPATWRSAGRLVFTDVNPGEVIVSRSRSSSFDAVLTLSNGEAVTLMRQFSILVPVVEYIEFVDGTVWSARDLKDRVLSDMASSGDDAIDGFAGDDTLRGMEGDDFLNGSDGDDTLRGMEGDDRLFGGSGDDALFGGRGNDELVRGSGVDSFDGGPGIDTVDFSYSSAAADFDLTAGQVVFDGGFTETLESIENVIGTERKNTITGTDGANRIWGGDGYDTLRGMDGNDTLDGGPGDDIVRGMEGDDILSGDSGDDALFGGKGDDVLRGSAGNDTLHGGAWRRCAHRRSRCGHVHLQTLR